MIRQCLFILFIVGISCSAGYAQEQYSYMTDRIFQDQLDLYGYNFVPNQMEIPNEVQEDLRVGEYTFGIMGANLYIDGKGIKGVYSINNINPTEYGYKLNLMNARDPTIQGHLKIIQTKYGHVDALVFKRTTKDKEMIFFLPQIPKNLRLKEKKYFTDRWELPLTNIDSLWGQTIYPFLRIHDDQGIQERLQINDNTNLTFIKKVTKVEKKKKGRKKKKEEAKEEEVAMENIEIGIPDEEVVEEEPVVVAEPEPAPKKEVAAAPQKQSNARTSRKRQRFGGYESTTNYDEQEEEEEEEEEVVEEPTIEDTAASPPATAATEPTTPATDITEDGDDKDYKIITEYFIHLKTTLTYNDGTTEEVFKKYPIKKIVEREDVQAGLDEERFQLEIDLKKGDPIYLYLTSERTISSIEIDGKTYLMRGH